MPVKVKLKRWGGGAIEIFKSNEYGAGNVSVCAVTAKASDWSDQAKQCSTITINGAPSNTNSEPTNSEPTNSEPEYASGSNSSPKKSSSGYDITQFHFPGWPESNYMKQIYVPKGRDGIVFWSSPGGENNVAYGYVVEDTRYELIEQKNGWSHILFPGSPKMDGWVKNSDIVIKQETVCRADAVPVDLTGDWVEVVKNVLSVPFHQIPSALSHEINYILVIPENIPSEYQIYYKNQIMPNKDNRILHQSYEVYKIAPNTQSLGIDTTWAMRNDEWKEIPNWYITFNCYK